MATEEPLKLRTGPDTEKRRSSCEAELCDAATLLAM